ncbi:pre-peptidase C-terminal domain-containing protein [Mastigocoleus sp. MO_188.B34]|uniref:PPC domain-containing protein n=1 Tax=Mastigocoleus sp. MO_188.B34 TaxID=3036635 RepID=UPI00261F5864|nr:pre-peptidase C-terminal domain-containing protein [Mastigocoleus sp. MO_188.B34]
MFSSFLVASYSLPVNALMVEILDDKNTLLIAKTPDERPEIVQQGIEEIPVINPPQTSETPQQPSPTQEETTPINPQPAEPPASSNTIQPTSPAPGSETAAPTSPAPGTVAPTRPVPGTGTAAPARPAPRTAPRSPVVTPQPRNQPGNTQPQITREDPRTSPLVPSREVNYRQLNYVDIALGVLAPGDYEYNGRHFHFYQFEGRENQLIQIRLLGSGDRRRSSNLSMQPLMYLLDPDGNVILRRGGGIGPGSRDAFEFVRLPADGTYVVGVTTRDRGNTGRYSLALRNDRASYTVDEKDNLSTTGPILRRNRSPYNVSQFEGEKGQLVSIRVDSTFEEFSPYVVLLDSQGKIVATNNDKDGKFSALIDRAKLPEDGTYYVVVTSVSPGQAGAYRLTIF